MCQGCFKYLWSDGGDGLYFPITRPPMLDKALLSSWQQRNRLLLSVRIMGIKHLVKVNLMKDLYQMGTTRRNHDERNKIRATNIILQGLPKDIYSLINHYTDAKDIWDNVKMLLEGSELTKEDRESQLYDDFEHFPTNNEAHANENKMMLERLTQQTVDPLALMSNVSHQQSGLVMVEHRTELGNANPGQQGRAELILAGGLENNSMIKMWTLSQPVQDLASQCGIKVFKLMTCDAYDPLMIDEAPTAQTFSWQSSHPHPVYDEGPVLHKIQERLILRAECYTRFTEMQKTHVVVKTRCLELEAELSIYE
ncbi:hypothetical protein Tco_0324461 [Tanacetum coccineum]